MAKILITTGIFPPDIGGPASYGYVVAQRLAQTNEVTVLTYSSKWSHSADAKEKFKVIRIWKKLPKGIRHLRYLWRVWWLTRKHDIVLSLNAVSAGVPAAMATRFFKKPFFVRVVGDYAWEMAIQEGKTIYLINDFQKMPRTGRIARLHKWQVWVCKKSTGVIVPSEYLAGIVTGWEIDPEKIHVIYNGVNFEPSKLNKEEARKQLNIPGSIILSIGRLVPWKGFRMLIKIMPQLLQINQLFRLVIVGDGPDSSALQAMVRNLGLERKVFLIGKKSPQELANALAASDLFVLNTGYEGFSHQLLEAMVANVPIITTNVGGNKEMIEQAENGFMVKYNDEFNLIEAIKTLWQMPEVREKFVQAGQETVKKFSIEKMLDQTKKLLNV